MLSAHLFHNLTLSFPLALFSLLSAIRPLFQLTTLFVLLDISFVLAPKSLASRVHARPLTTVCFLLCMAANLPMVE